MPYQRRKAKDIFQTLRVPHQVGLYGGVSHGFALSANASEPLGKYGKEEAFFRQFVGLIPGLKKMLFDTNAICWMISGINNQRSPCELHVGH